MEGVEPQDYLYAGKPDMKYLSAEFEENYNDLSEYRQQMARNANLRFCKWVGQTDDGRKSGDDAFPFEGASDIRFPLMDDLISTNVATLVESFFRSSLVASPVEGSDTARAGLAGNFMKWLTRSQMDEIRDEVELAANFWEEKGGFVAGIFWDKQAIKWMERINARDIARVLMEQGQSPDSLNDPLAEEFIADLLRNAYPDAKEKHIAQAIQDLRETGSAKLPKSGLSVNRPCLRAFRKGEDIIFPRTAANVQVAPHVFRIEHKTPQQVKEYVITDGWDEKVVDGWIEKAAGHDNTAYDVNERNRDRFGLSFHRENEDGLIKVVWAYQRLIDKDGIPGIYETIFCPEYSDNVDEEQEKSFAKHGLCEYRLRGQYPFEDFSREKISRLSYNSRGLPDNGGDFQRIIKTYYDGEIDRQTIAMDPPLTYLIGRPPPQRGPGAMWPQARPGEVGYGETPQFDPATVEMRERLVDFARNYAGMSTDEEHANEARQKKQANINKWLRGWQRVYRKIFWLWQQYGDEMVTFRIMGSATTQPDEFHKNLDEDYDFYLEFDALSQEPELQQEKIKMLIEAFSAFDRNSRANWDGALIKAVETIDPTWAESLIKPEDQATQDESDQTMKDIDKMMAGWDVTIPEQGINTQLRRQILQQWVQGSEDIPAEDVQQLVQNQDHPVSKRVYKYLEQLNFIDTQRENAMVGRLGVKPGNLPIT